MATKQSTFYRRPLPATQISFSSPEGKKLFAEALAAHHMECYFALSEQFHTQTEPAYCGLGTLTMVLNALEIDPGRIWKGPWRYVAQAVNCSIVLGYLCLFVGGFLKICSTAALRSILLKSKVLHSASFSAWRVVTVRVWRHTVPMKQHQAASLAHSNISGNSYAILPLTTTTAFSSLLTTGKPSVRAAQATSVPLVATTPNAISF